MRVLPVIELDLEFGLLEYSNFVRGLELREKAKGAKKGF